MYNIYCLSTRFVKPLQGLIIMIRFNKFILTIKSNSFNNK